MDLKDFIKQVIADITDAIKESQDSLKNGCVVNPTIEYINKAGYREKERKTNEIEFDIALTVSSDNHGSISIAPFGTGIDRGTSELNRVKFSVSVCYPQPQSNNFPSKPGDKMPMYEGPLATIEQV